MDDTAERAPYDPMPHGAPEVGVGPLAAGPWPERTTAVRPGAARRGRPAQRGRPLPLLDASRRSSPTSTARRHAFHVAIENWQHDFNIGTVVRTANAFLAAEVHIVGRRRWNRRGAMVTDRYQHVRHHATVDDLVAWAAERGLPLVGIDNLPGSRAARDRRRCRGACVLLFGQEGPGLSDEAPRAACDDALLDRPVRLDPVDQRRRRRRRSPCTPGCVRTRISAAAVPGAGERAQRRVLE